MGIAVLNIRPTTNWLDLLRQSGEADLGAAMIRLARAAAEMHRQEQADAALASREATGVHDTEEERDHGRSRGSNVVSARDGGSERTEANR